MTNHYQQESFRPEVATAPAGGPAISALQAEYMQTILPDRLLRWEPQTPLEQAQSTVDSLVPSLVPKQQAEQVTALQDAVLSGNADDIGRALRGIGNDWEHQCQITDTVNDNLRHSGTQLAVFNTVDGFVVTDDSSGVAVEFSRSGKVEDVKNSDYVGNPMRGPVPYGLDPDEALQMMSDRGVSEVNFTSKMMDDISDFQRSQSGYERLPMPPYETFRQPIEEPIYFDAGPARFADVNQQAKLNV